MRTPAIDPQDTIMVIALVIDIVIVTVFIALILLSFLPTSTQKKLLTLLSGKSPSDGQT